MIRKILTPTRSHSDLCQFLFGDERQMFVFDSPNAARKALIGGFTSLSMGSMFSLPEHPSNKSFLRKAETADTKVEGTFFSFMVRRWTTFILDKSSKFRFFCYRQKRKWKEKRVSKHVQHKFALRQLLLILRFNRKGKSTLQSTCETKPGRCLHIAYVHKPSRGLMMASTQL